MGPHRVFPGRLSVSRTFGDIEAKLKKYEGNPKVVIAEPDIVAFRIEKTHDYIFLACDGIFDKLSNKDVIHIIWQNLKRKELPGTLHEACGDSVDIVLKTSALRKTCDNITCVLIAFNNFDNLYKSNIEELEEDQIIENSLDKVYTDEQVNQIFKNQIGE